MRATRLAAACGLVSVVTAGTVLGLAPDALATPSDCSIIFNDNPRTVSSLCTSGTGEHRIHMILKHFDPSVGTIPVEGPWAPVGSLSTTGYPPHQIISKWIELRG